MGFYRHEPIVKTLFDDEVTAEKVKAAFGELAGKVQATDVFVLYMAGHGKTVDGDYHFLPPSMDGFSNDAIKRQGFGPETHPQMACEHPGAEDDPDLRHLRIRARPGRCSRHAMPLRTRPPIERMKEATGRTLFMAAGDQQSAIEGYRNHGVFTYALLEGLAKAGSGEQVQLFDLADYVQRRVPGLSRELKACEARGPEDLPEAQGAHRQCEFPHRAALSGHSCQARRRCAAD